MSAKFESYVLFELAGSIYGIPSQNVRHIEMFEQATPVPNANPTVDGVVFSRGQVIPALNLRVRFGFPRASATIRTRIVFTTVHNRTVGLIVDTAREFKNLPADSIGPIEETLTGVNGKYLKAVTNVDGRLVLILDIEAVLNVDDVQLPAEDEPARTEQLTTQ
jgi:purine-binding chemotaxis protein CheW